MEDCGKAPVSFSPRPPTGELTEFIDKFPALIGNGGDVCHQSVLAYLMLLVEWRSFLPPYLSRGKMPTCETKKKTEKKEEREKDRKGLVVSVLACQSPPGPIRASPHLVGRQIKSESGETGGRERARLSADVCAQRWLGGW